MNTTEQKKHKVDTLLSAIEQDDNINLLYDCWTLLQRAPSRAVEILMQFKDVAASAKIAVADIQEALSRYDQLKARLPELKEAAKQIDEWNKSVAGTDEGRVLNRLNRIIEISQKLAELKKSGSLDMIEALLKSPR